MSLTLSQRLAVTIAAATLAAAPAFAQERSTNVYVDVGGLSAARDLNAAGADFKAGFNLGAGVGWTLRRNVMLRGVLDWGRQQLRNSGIATGVKVNEFFYGADVALRYPNLGRTMPYAFIGAGAVTIHPIGTSGENKTKGVGRFGLGLTYQPPRSRFDLFAQGSGWLYKLSGFQSTSPLAGYDRSQLALAYVGGVSLRL